METLFGFLFFISVFALIAGLVKPSIFTDTKNGVALTRPQITLFFGILALMFMGLAALFEPNEKPKSDESPSPTPSTVAVSESTPQATPQPTATSQPSPSQVFENIGSKVNDQIIVTSRQDANGEWIVLGSLNVSSPIFSGSKQLARDFVFGVYATDLPIKNAALVIGGGGKNYSAFLGKNQAATEPKTTWTSNSVGPTIFYDWLKKYSANLDTPYEDRTFVKTNLD